MDGGSGSAITPAGGTRMGFSQVGFLPEFLHDMLCASFLSGVCDYPFTTMQNKTRGGWRIVGGINSSHGYCDATHRFNVTMCLCPVLSCPLPPEPPPHIEGSV